MLAVTTVAPATAARSPQSPRAAPTPSRLPASRGGAFCSRSRRQRGPVSRDLRSLQRRLRLKFNDPALLAQALVHRSYLNEAPEPGTESNERLEFLGDAVLGLVIAHWLYERYPDQPEGRLTELRSHLVKAETLAEVARRLNLGAHLRLGRGEDATGGRTRPLNQARVLEAVIGAAFLDRGFRKTQVWLLRLLDEELSGLGGGELPEDAKSRLQHVAQMHFAMTPRYTIVSTEGPDHEKVFTVEVRVGDHALGVGRGRSKRIAEREAAETALAAIDAGHGA